MRFVSLVLSYERAKCGPSGGWVLDLLWDADYATWYVHCATGQFWICATGQPVIA